MPAPIEEVENWLKFSSLILVVLLPCMRVLFKLKWDDAYAALGFPWNDDTSSVEVFINGSSDWTPWLLLKPLGGISLQTGKTQGQTTDDWKAEGVQAGDQIRIRDSSGTEHYLEVSADPSSNKVRFKQPYTGPTELANAEKVQRTRTVDAARRHDGSSIDAHIKKSLREGDTNQWDVTALNMALIGLVPQIIHYSRRIG